LPVELPLKWTRRWQL